VQQTPRDTKTILYAVDLQVTALLRVRRQGLEPRTRGLRARTRSYRPGFDSCQLVSFPQVSNKSPCHWVPFGAAPVHRNRALIEHRDGGSVLHRSIEAGEW